ncbi:putative ribonuclease H-like domain-containing protein, partial [Tanacetum coccineum]
MGSLLLRPQQGNPQQALKNKGIFDSGYSRHMTGNKDFLTDYQDIDGGFVAFGGSARGVLLRVPRQSNMYSFDLKNVVPSGDLTCLFAKAIIDESKLWHRRLGHVNFKTMNKLVKGNLVRGLPSKIFDNDHTCVACQKGKQHKASCKAKLMSSISQPLQLLHMDLFGPTSVRSINHKTYYLVVTDDFSRCNNGTKFKNREMNEFCGLKGIKKEFSVARTPQQNGVAERKNRTLIETASIMLADSLLLVMQGPNWLFDIDSLTNSMNYQPVTAGNQTDKNVGPQETNGDTGLKKNVDTGQPGKENVSTQQYIVLPLWYSISSSYKSSDKKARDDTADDAVGKKTVQEPASEDEQALRDALDKMMNQEKEATEQSNDVKKEFKAECNRQLLQGKATRDNSTNNFNTVSTPVNAANAFRGVNAASASRTFSDTGPSSVPLVVGAEADFNNMEPSTVVSPIPTTRVHTIHSKDQIIRDPKLAVQIRGMTKKSSREHAMISYIQKQRRTNHKDYQNCLFACFLSQQEPKKIAEALDDESWVEAMQEELLQFKIQKVWTLVDLPYGKKAIGTKWVYRNKKDERGIVVRNKARLVAQGHKQEEGIDYDEVFAPVARVEEIRLFLAFASFMNFLLYQMDVKSAFLYGTIEEE